MKAILSLFALLLAAASAHAEGIKDYRARTVYFLLTDRFNPNTPYSPYVDPEYPDATNSVNCFVEVCTPDLSGYDQHNRIIADYLVNAGQRWMRGGADDFRLDAVKFPFPEFIARFTNTMIAYAQQLGRSAPYFVREWSGGGVGDPKSLAFANAYPFFKTNIFDFMLSLALNQFIGGSYEDPSQQLSAQGLDTLLQQRVAAFNGRDDWQGTFIDNHDQMRTLVRLQKLGVEEAERDGRLDLATVLLMTVRGIPVIYYGDEQYLAYYDDGHNTPPENINSDDDDPYNRPSMTSWSPNTPAEEHC